LDPFSYFVPHVEYFYYYLGSSAAPPCTPSMEWILVPTPVTVYARSLSLYRNILEEFPGNRLGKLGSMPQWSPLATAASPPAGLGSLSTNSRPLQEIGADTEWGTAEKWVKNCPRDIIGRCIVATTLPPTTRKLWQINNKPNASIDPIHYLDSSPPWASGGSAGSDEYFMSSGSSRSSSESAESDSSGGSSMKSWRVIGSGSSGSYMAFWKWTILLFCCWFGCCGLCLAPLLANKFDGQKRPVIRMTTQRQRIEEKHKEHLDEEDGASESGSDE